MMYIRYIFSAVSIILVKVLATILSPIIALFVDKDNETIPLFKWAVTHDAPLDAWWTDGYQMDHWLKRRYTQKDYDSKAWVRWYSRVKWIIRNPGYGWSKKIGYDQKGMEMVKHRDESHLWDRGYPNCSYYTAINSKGQRGFLYQRQIYYYKQWCVEIYLGWKLFWTEEDQTCMAVARISPIRKYVKREVNSES